MMTLICKFSAFSRCTAYHEQRTLEYQFNCQVLGQGVNILRVSARSCRSSELACESCDGQVTFQIPLA